jgi:hypothetical protein
MDIAAFHGDGVATSGGITLAAAGQAVRVHPVTVHPLRSLWDK